MGCNFMGNYMTREVLSKPVTTRKVIISLKVTLFREIFANGNRGLPHQLSLPQSIS